MNYYNEFDPKAAAWLRELIAAGHIPPGDVDERSITEVRPHELEPYTQCHFFAGISGWSLALRLAGWPSTRPVWTASLPCQPFSAAGKQEGGGDARNLWTPFFALVQRCGPQRLFGEQVEAAIGFGWLDRVFADLGAEGYACGAAVLGAHSVGAPHRRQRVYWMADAQHAERRTEHQEHGEAYGRDGFGGSGHLGSLAIANGRNTSAEGLQCSGDNATGARFNGTLINAEGEARNEARLRVSGTRCSASDSPMDYSSLTGGDEREHERQTQSGINGENDGILGASGAWSNFDIIPCRDGKARRIESGTFPLVAGLPRGVVPSGTPSVQEAQASGEARVARLRGYGNAIVAPLAAQFIIACEEAIHQ